MSWIKKLIFVDSEEESSKNNKVSETRNNHENEQTPHKAYVQKEPTVNLNELNTLGYEQTVIDPSAILGKVNQEQLAKLYETIEEQTIDGIDYVKFKKSVNSLKEILADENARFSTAFVSLKATYPELSKTSLLQTIDRYISLMEDERLKGLNELDQLRVKNVEKKEQDIVKALKDVEQMKAEILKLTTFIAETNEELTSKKNEYAIQQANFNATIDKIVNQLNGDKIKIETIIK